MSLIYDKSYQHLTIYDSYDLELAAKMIQSIKFENTTSTYSLTGKLEYDYKNHDEKTMLYKMFVAYNYYCYYYCYYHYYHFYSLQRNWFFEVIFTILNCE